MVDCGFRCVGVCECMECISGSVNQLLSKSNRIVLGKYNSLVAVT